MPSRASSPRRQSPSRPTLKETTDDRACPPRIARTTDQEARMTTTTAVKSSPAEAAVESPYRWVIVAAGALMTCVAVGAMFSLAVFLEPLSAATGWSRAGISAAMSLNFLTMGVGAFVWGAATDRFGARLVVLSGA